MAAGVKVSAKELAAKFVAKCAEYGFGFSVSPNIVTVFKAIPKEDGMAFAHAESDASSLLDYAPHKGGSIWGTDGGSIGGAVAMKNGFFKMNKSGSGGVSFAKEVAKISAKN